MEHVSSKILDRRATRSGNLLAMNRSLAELEARQTVVRIQRITNDVRIFGAHAKMLSGTKNIDSAVLVEEANGLLQKLGFARITFMDAESRIETLARSLPSRPLHGGGMSPAAQWVPELRGAAKQFERAVKDAEGSLKKLYSEAFAGLNSPTRISTPADGVLDNILLFTDLLMKIIEWYKRNHKR